MNWKIWQKSKQDVQSRGGSTTIPEPVARYMVVDLQQEAEWVWYLKAVIKPRPDAKHVYDFRVYEGGKALAKKIQVTEFSSLDDYPELIVLQGAYNRRSGDVWAEPARGSEHLEAA